MIRISQIDNELSIYKNNTVVLFGVGEGFEDIANLLVKNNVKIDYVCDINKEICGKYHCNFSVLSVEELIKKLDEGKNEKLIIQVSDKTITDIDIEKYFSKKYDYLVSFDEAHKILHLISFINLYKLYPDNPIFSYRDPKNSLDEKKLINNFINLNDKFPVFIVNPTKTADYTLEYTFDKYNIPNCYTFHNANLINTTDLINKKIKIITAVRDPIARNISMLYQMIANNKSYLNSFNLTKNVKDFWLNGGDAQVWFDRIIAEGWINDSYFNISTFMNSFKENIIDLSKYTFDNKKGYSIVKEGNIEVFVYQLEKMNDSTKEMSDWLNLTPFSEWEVSNEASGKWIASSYKQALTDIKFTREYFDRCYVDPWIKHFYSTEDIEKFKERWRPHIID